MAGAVAVAEPVGPTVPGTSGTTPESLAGAGTGKWDLVGSRAADRGGLGGGTPVGESRAAVRARRVGGDGRSAAGVAGDDATARAAAEGAGDEEGMVRLDACLFRFFLTFLFLCFRLLSSCETIP